MSNSNQEIIEARLAAYVDGELDPSERVDLEAHLEQNPQYRQLLEGLSKERELLRGLPREAAPAEFAEAYGIQLERSGLFGAAASIDHSPRLRIASHSRLFATAAILLLTTGLTIIVYKVLPDPKPSSVALAPEVESGQSESAPGSSGGAAENRPGSRDEKRIASATQRSEPPAGSGAPVAPSSLGASDRFASVHAPAMTAPGSVASDASLADGQRGFSESSATAPARALPAPASPGPVAPASPGPLASGGPAAADKRPDGRPLPSFAMARSGNSENEGVASSPAPRGARPQAALSPASPAPALPGQPPQQIAASADPREAMLRKGAAIDAMDGLHVPGQSGQGASADELQQAAQKLSENPSVAQLLNDTNLADPQGQQAIAAPESGIVLVVRSKNPEQLGAQLDDYAKAQNIGLRRAPAPIELALNTAPSDDLRHEDLPPAKRPAHVDSTDDDAATNQTVVSGTGSAELKMAPEAGVANTQNSAAGGANRETPGSNSPDRFLRASHDGLTDQSQANAGFNGSPKQTNVANKAASTNASTSLPAGATQNTTAAQNATAAQNSAPAPNANAISNATSAYVAYRQVYVARRLSVQQRVDLNTCLAKNGPVGAAPVGTAPVGTAPVGTAPVGTAPVGTAPVGLTAHQQAYARPEPQATGEGNPPGAQARLNPSTLADQTERERQLAMSPQSQPATSLQGAGSKDAGDPAAIGRTASSGPSSLPAAQAAAVSRGESFRVTYADGTTETLKVAEDGTVDPKAFVVQKVKPPEVAGKTLEEIGKVLGQPESVAGADAPYDLPAVARVDRLSNVETDREKVKPDPSNASTQMEAVRNRAGRFGAAPGAATEPAAPAVAGGMDVVIVVEPQGTVAATNPSEATGGAGAVK